MDQTEAERRIAELEDEIKQRDRRVEELKREVDEGRDMIRRMEEHVEDRGNLIDSWIEAFDMRLDDDGVWKWRASFAEGLEWYEKYLALLKEWNKSVAEFNATIRPRNVGRPLAASKAQCVDVLKRRKRGESLQHIVDETNLSMQTVRTIIDKKDGVDRTTGKHLQRIKPEDMAAWKARKRTRDALPRRINALLKDKADLLKEAKGLK